MAVRIQFALMIVSNEHKTVPPF